MDSDLNPTGGTFSPDRPIASRRDDLLGRAPFANELADAIAQWRDRESFVLALVGPWGEGKTSIKNMALERLKERSADSPIPILEFNPWEWATQGRIVEGFFRDLEAILGQADRSETGRRRAERMHSYAQVLGAGSKVFGKVPAMLAAIVAALAATGFAGLTSGPAHSVLTVASLALVLVAGIVGSSGEWLERVAGFTAKRAESMQRTLAEIKADLARLMLDHLPVAPVVVVLDDLDRLSTDDVRAVLQLVRANADLPNLIYLLMYDEEMLVHTLDQAYAGKGAAALEKVVQASFPVPRMEVGQVAAVTSERMQEILTPSGIAAWDELEWANLLASGLSDLMGNLRDSKRFLNIYGLHAQLLTKDNHFEVHPGDLAVMDVLRIIEPGLHAAIPGVKHLLTGSQGILNDKARMTTEYDAFLSLARESNRAVVSRILRRVFPPLELVLGNTLFHNEQYMRWAGERRVCSESAFDSYFSLSLPANRATRAQVASLVAATADDGALDAELVRLATIGVLDSALVQLQGKPESVPAAHLATFMRGLFRAGDSFLRTPTRAPFQRRLEGTASSTIRRVCRHRLDEAVYAAMFRDAVLATGALYLPNYLGSWELKPEGVEGPLSEEAATAIREACVSAIQQAAEDGSLVTHPELASLLYNWRRWGPDGQMQQWFRGQVLNVDEFEAFSLHFGGFHTSGSLEDPVHRAEFTPERGLTADLLGQDYVDALTRDRHGEEPGGGQPGETP